MIVNNVYRKNQITEFWVSIPKIFNDEEIDKICKICEESDQISASVINGQDFSIRKSNVSYHFLNDTNSWIFENLNFAIQ